MEMFFSSSRLQLILSVTNLAVNFVPASRLTEDLRSLSRILCSENWLSRNMPNRYKLVTIRGEISIVF